jgi:hypothetical protein
MKCPLNQLPYELLEEIFLRLDGTHLCQSVGRVCKRWRDSLANDSFWTQKCINDGKMNKKLLSILNEKQIVWSPKKTYFYNTFMKNFIKNPNGDNSFNHWSFDCYDILRDTKTSSIEKAIKSYKETRTIRLELKSLNFDWLNQLHMWTSIFMTRKTLIFHTFLDSVL